MQASIEPSEVDTPRRTKCLSKAIRDSQYNPEFPIFFSALPKRFDNDKTLNRLSKYRESTTSDALGLNNTTVPPPMAERKTQLSSKSCRSKKKPGSMRVNTNNPFKQDPDTLLNNYTPLTPKPLTEVKDYIIKRDIGQGTFGSVKLAEHRLTHEQVAIKMILKSSIKTERAQKRIEQEIKLLPLLNHPHIVKVLDVIEDSDRYMIIMEYLESGELFHYIVKNKRVNERESRYFFRQIISALDYCHTNSIVHRDVKPENLSLDGDMQVRLIDFGFAAFYDQRQKLNTFCGSPYYASPEMIKGVEYMGPEVDVWSLGVTLFTMLSGRLPFNSSNIKLFQKQVIKGEYEMPVYFSKEVKNLLTKMLQIDPLKRIGMEKIRTHPWTNLGHSDLPPSYLNIRPSIVRHPNPSTLMELEKFGIDSTNAKTNLMVSEKKPTKVVNLYHLIEESKCCKRSDLIKSGSKRRESRKIILNGPNYEPSKAKRESRRFSTDTTTSSIIVSNEDYITKAGRSFDSVSRRSTIPNIMPSNFDDKYGELGFEKKNILSKEAKEGWFSGLFNVSAVSDKHYVQICQEIERVLTIYLVTYIQLENRFVCELKDRPYKLQFEIKISAKNSNDDCPGFRSKSLVQFRNLKGSPWNHKKICGKLVHRMYL